MEHPHLHSRAQTDRHLLDARMREVDFNLAPFTVIWEVTRSCSLACLHCRAEAQPRRHPDELTTEEGYRLLEQIRSCGHPIMVFTGGDPMMRRDLFDLLKKSVDLGLRTSLTPTASALVTRERLERVRDLGVRRIAVSLDGPDAATHDFFRGFRGSFDRTVGILDLAQALGMSLQVNTVVSRYNVSKLDAMIPLLERYGVVQWSVFFLVPVGRGQILDMIGAEEHERVFHWLWELSKKASFDVKATAAPHFRRVAIQRELELKRKEGGEGAVSFTGAGFQYADGLDRPVQGVNEGRGLVFISHLGEVFPSGFLPICAGNVRDQSLVEIYRNAPLFRELRDGSLLGGKCGKCEYRRICGGSRARAYGVTGDYLAEDPTCVYQPGEAVAEPV